VKQMGEYNNEKYPVGALKPKAETGVLNFLQKYPNYNGQNTIIAILDSGVDPNANGLQVKFIKIHFDHKTFFQRQYYLKSF
jgi:hypothetical protein